MSNTAPTGNDVTNIKKHYCSAYDENDSNPYGCIRCPGKNKDSPFSQSGSMNNIEYNFMSYKCFRY